MRVDVFITGRMYHLAGGAPDHLDLDEQATLAAALAKLRELSSEPLPESTLVTVSGRHQGALSNFDDCELSDGDELMLVAPVAGG
jgi:molybdopterin converting factor small subunit